jgi:hypothetical protein
MTDTPQLYAATVTWMNPAGCYLDTWTHPEPDSLDRVIAMVGMIADRPPNTAHVRIEPAEGK